MTDKEVINKILAKMDVGTHYRFYDRWVDVTGIPIDSVARRKEIQRILKVMMNKGWLGLIRYEDSEVIVALGGEGIKLKEEIKLKESRAIKSAEIKKHATNAGTTVFKIIGGLGVLVALIVGVFELKDRFWPEPTEPTTTQVDSLNQQPPAVINDSTKTDSTKQN